MLPKEEKNGGPVKPLICAALFMLLALAMLLSAAQLLRDKSSDRNVLLDGDLARETAWDVLLAGSSRIYNTVYPLELWRDYGLVSFNNGQVGEMLPVTYWTCKSAIRQYHPKVLVLDLNGLGHAYNYYSLPYTHGSLDPLPARERIPAILDLIPKEDRGEFFFPMELYHTRWKELGEADFEQPDYLMRGSDMFFGISEEKNMLGVTVPTVPEDMKKQPFDRPLEYLDKITELCESTGTELLLIYVPGFFTEEYEKLRDAQQIPNAMQFANWMADYAAEKGLQYINFYQLTEELGFDYETDMYNCGHLNYRGGY